MADERRMAAAWTSMLPAALHLVYASQHGIATDPAVRWALALGTVVGSALVWTAARRGPWALAWAGLALIVLPAVPAWPAIGVSPGGLLALLLMLVTAIAVAVASARQPPALSPARP